MNPEFLDGIDALGKWYFAEVPVTTLVWPEDVKILPAGPGHPGNLKKGRPRIGPRVARNEPLPQEVREIGASLPAKAWKRFTIKEGARGPITADFAFVRAVSKRGRRPGHEVWVIFRRSTSDPTEIKYFLSNAPAKIAKTDLVRQAGFRWPIETALEEGKSELGMDHYETRTWHGWHHHMTLTFLAHHFLVRLRLKRKNSPALTLQQSKVLMQSVLGLPEPDFKLALEIVTYHQERNYAAYCSHRKRTLKVLKRRGKKPK